MGRTEIVAGADDKLAATPCGDGSHGGSNQ